ncbi:MAG: PBP1A family penicillin-binding protein [Magnetovibrio sp.]|nr:PBP1A family penicillin-binding protein [Magnetovibrio sp.]
MSKKSKNDAPFFDEGEIKKGPRWKRFLYWTAVVCVWGIAIGGIGAAYIAWDLPDVDEAISATRKPTIRVVTQSGVELARRGDRYGQPVLLDELPPELPHAILATEDRRFYDHWGVDPIGIARAMWVNIRAGGIRQGGSTLTQQAAKNLFLTPKRTLKRKLQEVVLALWLEAKFSKDQILTIYLNRVYFGQGTYGVDAASRFYFKVPARKLSAYQAAVLAGMLKGPNKYNPMFEPDLSRQRTAVVLSNMVKAGYLTEADRKLIQPPKTWWRYNKKRSQPMAHYFVDWVLDQAGDFVTLDKDVNVIVTIDHRMQHAAERLVANLMKKGGAAAARDVSQVALVALSPEGAVLAMIGGANYKTSKFNRAVQAKRQPGSAFKPIVFLAGFDTGLSPDSVMADEPITIEEWSPQNFKKEYLGDMTLKEAMKRSINTVAVKVSEHAGRDNVQAMAKKLGITARLTDAPSLALGVSELSLLEITAAYGPFANGGYGVWPYAISEIQDAHGNALYVRSGGGPGRVIPKGYAGAMNSMLSEVINSDKGTGKGARIKRPAAGKTGTSQGYRDAWFVGYTPDLITGVWMGNDNGTSMKRVTGGGLPTRLWRDFMTQALANTKAKALPSGKVTDRSDEGGEVHEENPVETFIKGIFNSIFN